MYFKNCFGFNRSILVDFEIISSVINYIRILRNKHYNELQQQYESQTVIFSEDTERESRSVVMLFL